MLTSIPNDVQSGARFPTSTRTLFTLREHLDIIGRFVGGDGEPSAVHAEGSGLLRGIALSVGLFDDVEWSLRAPRQLG